MRIVFMGTPGFAVPSLESLLRAGHQVLAVVTQPDKPVGRKRLLTPPPLKVAAMQHGIPVLQPDRARDPEFLRSVRELAPELVAYAAYGKILPQAFLEIPPLGCLNVHASLLPAYRGAAPIQWAIINGETLTGVSIMRAEAGLDTGPVLLRREEPILPDDTAGTLGERLAKLGAEALIEAIALLQSGQAHFEPQDDGRATYAPPIKAEDAALDWGQPAERLRNKVRALNPKPGAVVRALGRELKVWRAAVADGRLGAAPGTVVELLDEGPAVQTGDGALVLQEVQPAGGRRQGGADFARGSRIEVGDNLAGSA
jgi:methionyl-tRNA formyltransferase